jgi:hypothetical protein
MSSNNNEITLVLACKDLTARFEKLFGESVPLTEALTLELVHKHPRAFDTSDWEAEDFDFDFGWEALHLLSPSARAAYEADMASAEAAYDAALVLIDATYRAAKVSANAAYDSAIATYAAYDATMLPVRAAYWAARDAANATRHTAMIPVRDAYPAAKVVAFARVYCWSAP